MRVLAIAIVLLVCSTANAQETLRCRDVIGCAQEAAEIAATSRQAIDTLNAEISALRGEIEALRAELATAVTNSTNQNTSLNSKIDRVNSDVQTRVKVGETISVESTNGTGCVNPAGGGRAEKSIYMHTCPKKLFRLKR